MDKTIVIPEGYAAMRIADLPDVCFLHPKARDNPGMVYYAPDLASDLVNVRVDYFAGEPQNFTDCLLVLGSVPHITIQWTADQQQFSFGTGCTGVWMFRPWGGGCCVRVGNDVSAVGVDCLLNSNAYLSVGDDCMFELCHLHVGDSHAVFDLSTQEVLNVREQPSIVIREHVWVGLMASVMMDSDIGAGCVVATRALVKGVFPPYSLLAGLPAKVSQEHISWTRAHDGQGREKVAEYLQEISHR